ncbi:DNA alkylation repair protein [Bacteroidales bacterium OttesenSCG-928-M11]|nr:DNA alkylation repair protein [Bacteroidales bacterium OttesenSCG-928-M11]
MEEIINQIRKKLYLLKDGASSASMREKGLDYKMNWGVPTLSLKNLAKDYSPNPELAELLWKKNTRELRIMATMIHDPYSFNQANRWVKEINTPELAEQAVMNLFSKLNNAPELAFDWIRSEENYIRLSSVLLFVRLFMQGYKLPEEKEKEYFLLILPLLSDTSLAINTKVLNALRYQANQDQSVAQRIRLALDSETSLSISLKENVKEDLTL